MAQAFETYTFPSSDGTSVCAGIAVSPSDDPRALLIISHGMEEHMERYLPFMQILASRGILCFGHDHIGHGKSVKSEKDLGYIPLHGGADFLIDDVICDAKRFRGCYPNVPLILFGHSMGSFIARLAVTTEDSNLFDALILAGTGGKNPLAPLALMFLSVMCVLRGERSHSRTMHSLIFAPYNERFEKRTPVDWLTTDKAIVDSYIADPLCGPQLFTLSSLFVLISLLYSANRSAAFRNTPNDLPILLISGRDDPVGGYGDGIHETADAYIRGGCTKVSHTLYSNARHELLNEPIAPQVISDILSFLDANLKCLSAKESSL